MQVPQKMNGRMAREGKRRHVGKEERREGRRGSKGRQNRREGK